jgi:hypothetical protein
MSEKPTTDLVDIAPPVRDDEMWAASGEVVAPVDPDVVEPWRQ